ncbi:MAG: zinc ribbon domain-containing protein [Elusimicrobia bacterium]|nr:zinc ribbon domain-containing protein [Elusimicrobiota bacterium]
MGSPREDAGAAPPARVLVECWSCKAVIEPSDRYCRHCGTGQGADVGWYYTPWGITVLTLLLLGPFALPFALKSPKLTPTGRRAAVVLIAAYTGYLAWGCWRLFHQLQLGGSAGAADLMLLLGRP